MGLLLASVFFMICDVQVAQGAKIWEVLEGLFLTLGR